jgi:hypothetical protein
MRALEEYAAARFTCTVCGTHDVLCARERWPRNSYVHHSRHTVAHPVGPVTQCLQSVPHAKPAGKCVGVHGAAAGQGYSKFAP